MVELPCRSCLEANMPEGCYLRTEVESVAEQHADSLDTADKAAAVVDDDIAAAVVAEKAAEHLSVEPIHCHSK